MLGSTVLNAVLRLFSAASRFIFYFSLIAFLDPSSVGKFGLISSIVAYGSLLLGLEFYYFSNREFVHNKGKTPRDVFSKAVKLNSLIYSFLIVVGLLILPTQDKPIIFILVIFLVILESLNQEIYRFLILINKNVHATTMLLIRSSLWIYLVLLIFFLNPELRTVELILPFWLVAGVFSAGIGLRTLVEEVGYEKIQPDLGKWFVKGLKICVPMFFASSIIRFLFVIDKVIFQYINGSPLLGAYVLFAGVGTVISLIAEAAIFSFYLRRLIDAGKRKDGLELKALTSKVIKRLCILTIAIIPVTVIVFFTIGFFPVDPLYIENWLTGVLLFLANVAFTFSIAYNSALYGMGCDNEIIIANVTSVILFFLSVYACSALEPLYAVQASLVFAFVVLTLIKRHYFIVKHKELHPT